MIELQLLNAAIAKRDFGSLVRHGLNHAKNFHDQKTAYSFIEKHLVEYGEMPSVESVVMACPEFEYVDATESIDTLALKLIERNLKLSQRKMLESLAADFGKMDAYKFQEKILQAAETLSEITMTRSKNGVNWTTSGQERFEDYQGSKQEDNMTTIPTLFPEVDEAIGQYEPGNLIGLIAFTSRGKSWLGLLSALAANRAGHTVLVESAEMSKKENQMRLDTLEGGFSNKGLRTGRLGYDEDRYRNYTDKFAKGVTNRPDLIIKTAEDWPNGLTIEQLQHDILKTKAQFVVIDQFNLMSFKGNTHEDRSALSRQLKQLAAKLNVVIFVLYQASGDYEKNNKANENGIRELKAPSMKDYSSTIAILQDPNVLYSFDSVTFKDEETGRIRGKALLNVIKSRNGGICELELSWCPNDGIMSPRKATDIF
jgi:replicative DNA helicase